MYIHVCMFMTVFVTVSHKFLSVRHYICRQKVCLHVYATVLMICTFLNNSVLVLLVSCLANTT